MTPVQTASPTTVRVTGGTIDYRFALDEPARFVVRSIYIDAAFGVTNALALERATATMLVDDDVWVALVEAIEGPARDLPRLRRMFEEPSVLD